jgi:hypothetical protein
MNLTPHFIHLTTFSLLTYLQNLKMHPRHVKVFCYDEWLIVSNNKQKRTTIPSSTKEGLRNIHDRYRFLVNKEVMVEDTETSFTVKMPLVKTTI